MYVAGSRHILNNMFVLIFYFYVAETKNDSIYILSWHTSYPFERITGKQYVVKNNCKFQNCFFTYDRTYFKDILYFDVILFNSIEIYDSNPKTAIPPVRSPEQKYIFVSKDSTDIFPGSPDYDGFFNYTFTYKRDSDVQWRFFVVKNKTDNKIIAPSTKDIKWMDVNNMEPISEEIKRKLKSKNQAAAWLVSHCHTRNKREDLVANLITELESFNLTITTTGNEPCVGSYEKFTPCSYGNKPDGTYSRDICNNWISSTHYFYLAFENSMNEDYVTEKVLTATKNFAIPIVFGGADYTKFLPTGSYIHANELKPKELASMMNDLIHDKNKYYEYLKWHKYYSIHDPKESADTDDVCALCAFLNDDKYESVSSVYTHFTWFFKF